MREYWQRKPLLIRGVWPGFTAPIDRAGLFQLARDPEVESRLITQFDGRRLLQHGPLSRLPSVRRARWTLLVQGVNLHDDSARQLLSRFRFVPDARLDDLMVSFATDGGGVGPHVDSYDVFLLQAAGRRCWRISRQRGLAQSTTTAVKTVRGFRASEEWLLDAGDMLYLPPGVAHEGIAQGECITCSIGFRAPSYQQLLEPWLVDYADHAVLGGRYTDSGVAATSHPARLPSSLTRQVHEQLSRRRPGRIDTDRFLLRYLSELKANVVFGVPANTSPRAEFRRRAVSHGVELDRRSRLIYAGAALGINGECVVPPAALMKSLRLLAEQRGLTAQQAKRLPAAGWTLLHDWYSAGWIVLGG